MPIDPRLMNHKKRSTGGLPAPPAGYAYLVDDAGNYILDDAGNYILVLL